MSDELPPDIIQVEECAIEVVKLIQRFIDHIRTMQEFSPPAIKRTNAEVVLSEVQLFHRMPNDLLSDVRRSSDLVASIFGDSIFAPKWFDARNHDNDRFAVVDQILWPLLTSLGACCHVLDQLPQTPQPSRTRRNHGDNKPPPPRGLLSIQNYTDIAVFMEFLVCTSILPHLQRNVLLSVEDRARHMLPKSLAGRIPRTSLLWGCAIPKDTPIMDGVSDVTKNAIWELRQTVVVMGRIILLDRFRPMLLPRHVADLYAAIFQSEAFEAQLQSQTRGQKISVPDSTDILTARYSQMLLMLLPDESRPPLSVVVVDPYSQARAYQTLLLQGTNAPIWLRQRVSRLLTNLACRDLPAIVQIFVRAASPSSEDMTGAALRLARALTALSNDKRDFYAALCHQLCKILDASNEAHMNQTAVPMDPNHMAGILTVWAVLDQLPLIILRRHVLPLLAEGFFPLANNQFPVHQLEHDSFDVHKAVNRIGSLLSVMPSACNPSKIGRLFLFPALPRQPQTQKEGTSVTILGQLIRLAAMASPVQRNVKQDALFVLRLLVQMMVQSSFPLSGESSMVDGTEVLAMMLIYSVAPSYLDMMQYRYSLPIEGGNAVVSTLDAVILEQSNEESDESILLADCMEKRAQMVIHDLLAPWTESKNHPTTNQVRPIDTESNEPTSSVDQNALKLQSTVFHLLLMCYFSSVAMPQPNATQLKHDLVCLPRLFYRERARMKVAVMMMLPSLCEQCSPEALLLGSGGGVAILTMIKLIIDGASMAVGDTSIPEIDEHDSEGPQLSEHMDRSCLFNKCDLLLGQDLEPPTELASNDGSDDDIPINDTLISTASLVVSLTIAMLELGSKQRSTDEENMLKSILPSLRSLAESNNSVRRSNSDFSVALAELADMASHAMALIAARSVINVGIPSSATADRSSRETLEDAVQQAEHDLNSDQPPLRARGVITLRRLAQSYLQAKEHRRKSQQLVVDVNDVSLGSSDPEITYAVKEFIRVAVMSLSDSESYVYLAGIQTIVAAADLSPRTVIPSIGQSICSGLLDFDGPNVDTSVVRLKLSLSQRIKLTEALIFTIRRRGRAVYEFVPMLMNFMLYGKSEQSVTEGGLDVLFQNQTHQYFTHGNSASDEEGATLEQIREGRDIRVRTGGPVFAAEENDVLRAACIAIVAEVTSMAPPSVVARYCSALIHLATNALQLESSRPVRRAAALIATALYNAVLREQQEASSMTGETSAWSILAVEIISSNDEALHTTLQRCVTAYDVAMNDCVSESTAKKMDRLYDPATVARCHEALAARSEADNVGIFAAAILFVKSVQYESRHPVIEIIRSRLNEKNKMNDGDIVRAMNGLEVDRDSLRFA